MAQADCIKVAVLGAESTGKTWLCEELAAHYQTVWVPEYAREYFNNSDIYNYTPEDLMVIAKRQVEMEKEFMPKAKNFLFCDTTLITLKIWAELEFGITPKPILELMSQSSYQLYLLTNNDVPWQKDELRQNKHSRELIYKLNLREIMDSGTPYDVIAGLDAQRLSSAIEGVDRRFKS